MEDSEEEDISVKKDSAISNGKDTNMSENNTCITCLLIRFLSLSIVSGDTE